jgi:hypothetical protein
MCLLCVHNAFKESKIDEIHMFVYVVQSKKAMSCCKSIPLLMFLQSANS